MSERLPVFVLLPNEFKFGRDIALRCPRPKRSAGRNASLTTPLGNSFPSPDAVLGDGDGAARHPYQANCLNARTFGWGNFLCVTRDQREGVGIVNQCRLEVRDE
jgi:hypothetical protein